MRLPLIDNQDQVERLVRNLTEVLPLSARATPALMADLRERLSATKITWNCKVIDVFYTGDEGGVTCHVIFDEEEKQQVFLVSITYLVFDRRVPGGEAGFIEGGNSSIKWRWAEGQYERLPSLARELLDRKW